jgi:hypothetical protein
MIHDAAPASHADLVSRLRACVERGHDRVTMLEFPVQPTTLGRVPWEDIDKTPLVDQTTWEANGLLVTVRGPVPAGLEVLEGDLGLRFTKSVRADIQVWDQSDSAVWWQPGVDVLGVSPWFSVPVPDAV